MRRFHVLAIVFSLITALAEVTVTFRMLGPAESVTGPPDPSSAQSVTQVAL